MSETHSIQQVLIDHAVAGGSRHEHHFGIEAYNDDRSVDSRGVPQVLVSLQKLAGACHGGYDRRMAMEMRNRLKQANRHLSEEGLTMELNHALEKLRFLTEGNLHNLEEYLYRTERVRFSNPF